MSWLASNDTLERNGLAFHTCCMHMSGLWLGIDHFCVANHTHSSGTVLVVSEGLYLIKGMDNGLENGMDYGLEDGMDYGLMEHAMEQ